MKSESRYCDLIIRNGKIIDGTGAPSRTADIGIQGDLIIAIGDLKNWTCRDDYDASGRVVSPGFIDSHAHDDYALLIDPGMAAKVSQGVTTVVTGNCGLSLAPLTLHAPGPSPLELLGEFHIYRYPTMRDYMEAIESAPPAVNVAVLVGHANLRVNVMDRIDRPATEAEILAMCELVGEAMEAGCIGISSGLAYDASQAADTSEVIELCKRAAAFDGIYCTHLRNESDQVCEAVAEAIQIGEEAGLPIVISHHKCMHKRNWGRSNETLAIINASQNLQDVALDVYPYIASSTVLLPERVTDAEKVLITWSEPYPAHTGRDLDDIAAEWGCSRVDAARRLCPGGAVYFNMSEADLQKIMQHPAAMIGSDGVPSHKHPHPRLWGTFPRVFARYVRELGVLSLPEAVRRMTGLPASVFGLDRRGTLEVGNYADIVVFDPVTILDKATFQNPTTPADGVHAVFTNGMPVWLDGTTAGNPAGRLLRRTKKSIKKENLQ